MARRRARATGTRRKAKGTFVLRGYHVVCRISRVTHRKKK